MKESDRRPGPYPYYGASGIVDHVSEYLFEGEHLLIAEDGENLRTRNTPIAFLASGRFWVNNHAHIVRGNERAITRYLCYALQHTDVSGYLTGSTLPKLTQGSLNRIPVPAPSLTEQRAIVSVLRSLDDKIDLNRRMNATLEATARAIFKAWFVDFEALPVEAGRREPVTMVEERAVQSGNGRPLLRGRVGDLCVLQREVVDPREHPAEQFAHFSIPAFDEGGCPHVQPGSAIKSIKFAVPAGSVLISKLNPRIPRIWRPDTARPDRCIASTEFLVLKPTLVEDEPFLYAMLGSDPVQTEFARRVSGTSGSHQRVHADDLLNIEVPLPSAQMRMAFGKVAGPTLSAQQGLLRESGTLAALRDTLLPKLLSGEVRVKDIA